MTYRELWNTLTPVCGEREAKSVARLVFEQRFGLDMTDICIGKDKQLSEETHNEMKKLLPACYKTSPCSMFWAARRSADGHSPCVRECSFRAPRQKG